MGIFSDCYYSSLLRQVESAACYNTLLRGCSPPVGRMSERLQSDFLAQQELAQRVNVFVGGVTCWHFLTTLQYVELPLLRGRLRPRWTMIPYFGARYSLVGSTIGFQLNLCGPANETFWFVGSVAMIFASEILLLRATTLWRKNIYATVFLVFCGAGHWALGITAFLMPLIYAWIKFASTCQIFLGRTGPVPFFLYTMLLDLTVLIATVVALYRMREARASSPLWSRLYKHGFIYFILTFAVNLMIFVFSCTMVNAFLADVFTTPSE
ncbi:hypothetical protein PHLGIDRAFT_443660 [Phlebiopsis gigantea 11061_1 CR5-6]|uniref:Uncharacterized protein n=1 Tax=Phlebiopsis gigantea (strain 11061_1 CR5-6) TaxID=745531 RepID=A0A0C3SAC1_PHLG1|nr:hypothetical protein PHLGIDRAFT_443660 [Phlebiopsis gigantea 11061_1 CR5-6]